MKYPRIDINFKSLIITVSVSLITGCALFFNLDLFDYMNTNLGSFSIVKN